MVDEEGFRTFLKNQKKPANIITQFIRFVSEFLGYLQKYQQKHLDTQHPEDLHAFFTWLDQHYRRPRINRYFYALKFYYEYLSETDLYYTANEILGIISLEALELKHFAGANPKVTKTLASHDIRTAAQLLAITRTKAAREQLAEEVNLPETAILELVKLSNLARIPGLKQKRARLFYDAGLDTLAKIAAYDDPKELVTFFASFVERSGFDGRAVSLSEAQFTLGMAQYLKPITEF
ncbi:MAG: DUF4332 domain-containing protein [Candidatus Hodarchaeota archaeon]